MRRYGLIRLLPAALAFPVSAWAQGREQALSWQDAVALASRSNPALRSARKSVESSEARYRGSFNGLLPGLSLTNRATDSESATGASRWQAEGTASLDIFNMKSFARIGGASAALRRAEADWMLESVELRLGLRRAFAELLFSQELLSVAGRVSDIRRQNAELVGLKYDSGRESKGNALRASAELAEAQALLAQAARGLRVARRELGRRLGLEGFRVFVASGSLEARLLPAPPDDGFAGDRHPAVLQRAASRAQNSASLRESRSSLWPSLSANYTRDVKGRTYFPSSQLGWSASGILSIPIFGAGPTAAYYDVSAATRDLEKSEEDLRSIREQVAVALESAWAGLADKIDQLSVQKAFLEAARQRNDEASVRYTSGLMSFENWELVVADLVNSERGWVRARRDAVLAEAEWDRALGLALGE